MLNHYDIGAISGGDQWKKVYGTILRTEGSRIYAILVATVCMNIILVVRQTPLSSDPFSMVRRHFLKSNASSLGVVVSQFGVVSGNEIEKIIRCQK